LLIQDGSALCRYPSRRRRRRRRRGGRKHFPGQWIRGADRCARVLLVRGRRSVWGWSWSC